MWQLFFALCHPLILANKNNYLKECMMVMADPLDLGHGKNVSKGKYLNTGVAAPTYCLVSVSIWFIFA